MKKWHAKIWKSTTGEKWHGAKGGEIWPGDIAVKAVGDINYGTLFTYMYRRFGPSEYGSDDYKDIAAWFLTTPNHFVALTVSPNPSGCRHSFGYMVNRNMFPYPWNENQIKLVTEALEAAIRDLLFPTYVRDVFINAAGKVKDEDVGEDHCSYFKWAGYGVNHKYFFNEGPA